MTSTHTDFMAHIYMHFDFADEETAQLARHKLEVWKQAFRLDKKLLYKFERSNETAVVEESRPAAKESEAVKVKGKGKSDATAKKSASKGEAKDGGNVQLLLRLGFS